jgi:hypothetical protein
MFRTEWDEYRARQAAHEIEVPDYADGWHRPSLETSERVWGLVGPALKARVSDLIPDYDWLAADEMDALAARGLQALTVVLGAAVAAGDSGGQLTVNTVFDALCRHWSDTYREAVEAGPATVSYEMSEVTLRASRRDLLRAGIRLDALWRVARRGVKGLYSTERVDRGGRTVTLDSSSRVLHEFLEAVGADPEYSVPGRGPRLLLATDQPPARTKRQDAAGGWAYNVVERADRSDQVIDRLEAAQIYLDVVALMEDVARAEQKAAGAASALLGYGVNAELSNHKPDRVFKIKSGKHAGKDRRVDSKRESNVWERYRQQPEDKRAAWRKDVNDLLEEHDAAAGWLSSVSGSSSSSSGAGSRAGWSRSGLASSGTPSTGTSRPTSGRWRSRRETRSRRSSAARAPRTARTRSTPTSSSGRRAGAGCSWPGPGRGVALRGVRWSCSTSTPRSSSRRPWSPCAPYAQTSRDG